MRKGVVLAVLALVVACIPPKQPKPVAAVAQTARPFNAAPTVTLVDAQQTGPMYRVQISTDITRDVMPTDDLALVVSVDDAEVGRYPVVGKYAGRPTRIKQEIELPLGDYELDLAYQGEHFAGMPFRVAEVPVWGGHRAIQIRMHPGTRISLREKKLWVGRWWPNDGQPPSWIVEWVHDGAVLTATSGREEHGIPPGATGLVGGAAGAFKSSRVVQNTVWAYGEEYPIPDVVAQTPGQWAARVVHAGSAPIAVVFTVFPGGQLGELSSRKVASVGWQESWSKRLEQRALNVSEVERLAAKLPVVSSNQPFDEPDQRRVGPEVPVRVSTSAVRALFRNKQLADAWNEFLTLNKDTVYVQPAAFTKGSRREPSKETKDAEKKTKLRALRTQIEQLIKKDGGPWKADEFPRS